MIEYGLLFLVVVALVAGGLALWRAVRGPAPSGRRVWLRGACLSFVAVPLVALPAYHLCRSRTVQVAGQMVRRVETAAPLVALTFDDGPTPAYTGEILALLQAEDVRATFFVVGQELEAHPDLARRIAAKGHELGNHTYTHARMMGLSWGRIAGEIERTDALIRAAGYQGEIHFRAPGCKKLFLLPLYLQLDGRKHIIWDNEPESDPAIARDADRITADVLQRARPGSIVLLHVMYPGGAETRKALPGIIRSLKERGYRLVTVSELLAAGRKSEKIGGILPALLRGLY